MINTLKFRLLKYSLLLFFILFTQALFSQDASPSEQHYQFLEKEYQRYREFLEEERTSHRQMLEKLEETIRQERADHQAYVENVYMWSAIFIGLVAIVFSGLITFTGWRTREKLRADFEAELRNRLKDQALVDKLLAMIQAEMDLANGKFLFIASQDAYHQLLTMEIQKLAGHNAMPVHQTDPDTSLTGYDVIIYNFDPADPKTGEDKTLEELIRKLSDLDRKVPLVVYAKGSLKIDGSTERILSDYGLYHMAKNPISLVDNTASAFRVARLKTKD